MQKLSLNVKASLNSRCIIIYNASCRDNKCIEKSRRHNSIKNESEDQPRQNNNVMERDNRYRAVGISVLLYSSGKKIVQRNSSPMLRRTARFGFPEWLQGNRR